MSKLRKDQLKRPVPSDIEISQALEGSLPHIAAVAEACGVLESELEPYGRSKAKVRFVTCFATCGGVFIFCNIMQISPVQSADQILRRDLPRFKPNCQHVEMMLMLFRRFSTWCQCAKTAFERLLETECWSRCTLLQQTVLRSGTGPCWRHWTAFCNVILLQRGAAGLL